MTHAFLRIGRVTRYLPRVKGLSSLLSAYRRVWPAGIRLEISDFDGNLRMSVDPTEAIGINLWHATRQFEAEERRAFCASIKPGSVVLDVGANIGIYTLLAAKRGARVFSIEADPKNVNSLRQNISLNHFDNVTVFPFAACDKAGELKLFRNPSNSGGSNVFSGEPSGVIPAITIDSLNIPSIDVCKMDIEGSELSALKGMTETIARSPNMKLFIECSDRHGDTTPLLNFLHSSFSRVITTNGKEISKFCDLIAVR